MAISVYNPPMDRRTFLESSVAAGVLASLPIKTFGATHRIEKVGVQLYTVRDVMKADFDGTLLKVAKIGFKEVEFAGYFNHSPKDVRASLDKVGLSAPSAHFGPDIIQNHLPETLEAAHVIGHQFIVCPWIEESDRKAPDGYKRVADTFNKAGEACKKAGIQFAYHNHNFEFYPAPTLNGQTPYDFLLTSTDPNNVQMEMDLCWITVGGQDPVKYFQNHPGRFPLVHVKDISKIPDAAATKSGPLSMEDIEKTMTAAGAGAIDWKRIFSHADEGGIKHYFVENDLPKDPFANIAESYKYLSQLQF
jgi:sugar phosphate isomerase/epimerase